MRLLSMNIWNTQGPTLRYREALPQVLAACEPDVILLQEVGFDGSVAPQSAYLAQHVGLYHERYFYAGDWQGREEGLAILSQYPIIEQYYQRLPDGGDGMGRIICGATITTNNGNVDVFTTHLAFPVSAHIERCTQADACISFMHKINPKLAVRPLLFGGDLNDVPGSKAFCVVSSHLRDAFTDWAPTKRWTFLARNPYAKSELVTNRCIDYIFLNTQVELIDAQLVGESPENKFASDHLGVLVDIGIH